MKPAAILLALASTVAAGLPRYAKCTDPSQCNSDYCAPMSNADCDKVVNCRVDCKPTMKAGLAVIVLINTQLRVRMTGSAIPTIAKEENAMTAVILATWPEAEPRTSL
ncbi:hypothetical protein FCIRC_4274 [Fusarium circinatum]|uniref:Extracellular membrane protein CFEM domain-containing protein n=1 Tax=Fusarium circinatum TaxID=48490 RepID=A0A8H5U7Z5_FUSCI|nr:hypothetical protein FCIRC_4274 [Fusarium circinatum]